jgi:hypothetical protein
MDAFYIMQKMHDRLGFGLFTGGTNGRMMCIFAFRKYRPRTWFGELRGTHLKRQKMARDRISAVSETLSPTISKVLVLSAIFNFT